MSNLVDDIPLPPHVYVPGVTPRHPASLFEEIKRSVRPQLAPSDLHKTVAFRAGRFYFQRGFYWECHEVLEPVWQHTSDPSPERDMVLALIQLANARLKVLMRQPRAAWRLCDMVGTHLSRCPKDRPIHGLTVSEMVAEVAAARRIAKDAMEALR